jgi:hypothetical protein
LKIESFSNATKPNSEFQNQQTSILAVVAADVFLAPLAGDSLRAVAFRPVRINHAIALKNKKLILQKPSYYFLFVCVTWTQKLLHAEFSQWSPLKPVVQLH